MTEIQDAEEKQTTYENFIARCPSCGFKNVLNRAQATQGTDDKLKVIVLEPCSILVN